jgi:hypothetical protein
MFINNILKIAPLYFAAKIIPIYLMKKYILILLLIILANTAIAQSNPIFITIPSLLYNVNFQTVRHRRNHYSINQEQLFYSLLPESFPADKIG